MSAVEVLVERPRELRVAPGRPAEAAPGEVVVRVERAGICGSDMHILHGENPFAVYPRVIGHEFMGTIVALGAGVTQRAEGERVVVDPVVACGRCYPCRIGRENVCARLEVIGVHRDGGFRSFVAVPAANAVPVPAAMPAELAALAEPLAVAANVCERTGVGADDTVLVYGAGTVGVTVTQVAKLLGARVVVADIDAARLSRALAFGADAVIHSPSQPVPAAVAGENDGLGPTVVIDGAGVPALLDEACRVASPAGRIGVLGFSSVPSPLSQQEVVKKELTIAGSRLNRRLLPRVVDWLASGRLSPAGMVTQVFPAGDAAAAFALIERAPDRTLKVQLQFD